MDLDRRGLDRRRAGRILNDDPYPDVFAANGGFAMSPSVIYLGSATGRDRAGLVVRRARHAWNNYAVLFDFDHDGDVDVVTANQGNSPTRPATGRCTPSSTRRAPSPTVPSWQSAETSIQNFLAFGDYDGDGWEDLAVSKWVELRERRLPQRRQARSQTTPVWTTGDDGDDKGVAWADVDGNLWPDLALGHDPTLLLRNVDGTLTLQLVGRRAPTSATATSGSSTSTTTATRTSRRSTSRTATCTST